MEWRCGWGTGTKKAQEWLNYGLYRIANYMKDDFMDQRFFIVTNMS